MSAEKNTTTVTLELSEKMAKDIDHLVKEIGLKSREDLYRNALSLMKWATKESLNGRSIAAIDPKSNTHRILLMPPLEFAASR